MLEINTFACALLLGSFKSIQAFTPKSPYAATNPNNAPLSLSFKSTDFLSPAPFISSYASTSIQMTASWDEDDEDEDKSMSFDDAGRAIRDEEEAARAERSGGNITDEKNKEFAANKSEYDSMREKIRSRASDLQIEKSVTTRKAIEEANRRAVAREEPQELDLSKFGLGSIGQDPEDELTEEEMVKIDATGQKNLFEQAIDELNSAKFPGVGATIRQTGFMLIIFAFTAGYILLLDETVRNLYTDNGLIPRPDQVFDYSDLEMPEGWTDMMNENDLMS